MPTGSVCGCGNGEQGAEIPRRCVQAVTVAGDAVLDPYAGSGTTLIACEQLGRRGYMVEVNPVYCDVIRRRYADYVNMPELAP